MHDAAIAGNDFLRDELNRLLRRPYKFLTSKM